MIEQNVAYQINKSVSACLQFDAKIKVYEYSEDYQSFVAATEIW